VPFPSPALPEEPQVLLSPEELAALVERARTFATASKSSNTLRAYRSDFAHYQDWCAGAGAIPLPATPQTVSLYLTAMADAPLPGYKATTIHRRLSCIATAHKIVGLDDPTKDPAVRAVWQGIARTKTLAVDQKTPATTPTVRQFVASLGDDLPDVRDRAVVLLGFAGGPYGEHPETCPVAALRTWIERGGISSGPLFRSISRSGQVGEEAIHPQTVTDIVKRLAHASGLDPAAFASHSLRSGLVTSAAAAGADVGDIAAHTGHRSLSAIWHLIQKSQIFLNNPAKRVGL